MKVLCDKLLLKMLCDYWGIMKTSLFKYKLAWLLLGYFFIPAFGLTDANQDSEYVKAPSGNSNVLIPTKATN